MEDNHEVQGIQEVQEIQEIQDIQENQNQNRCSMCNDEAPEQDLTDAAYSELRCGHRVHTYCLINQIVLVRLRHNMPNDITCNLCDIPLVDAETQEYYHTVHENRPHRTTTVRELWETNENFRRDIKAYKKATTEYNKAFRAFNRDAKAVRTRYLQTVDPSVQFIKDQKRVATQEFNRIATKRAFLSKSASITRIRNIIRRNYTASFWDIVDGLREIQGAPKIRRLTYYSWRLRASSFFRVRI
jgi:hypothetical protein